MPPRGRPPGANGGKKARQRWEEERRRMWEEERRFEELEADDDDGQGVYLDNYVHPHRFATDDIRFTSLDLGPTSSRDGRRQRVFESDSASSVEDEASRQQEEEERARASMQVALRDKEELLAQTAMDRMKRARTMGKPNVTLTQSELDALLRTQQQIGASGRLKGRESASSGGSGSDGKRGRRGSGTAMTTTEVAGSRRRKGRARKVYTDDLRQSKSSTALPALAPRSSAVYQRRSQRALRAQEPQMAELSRYSSLPDGARRSGGEQPATPPRGATRRPLLPHDPAWKPRSGSSSSLRSPDPFHYQTYPPPGPPPVPSQYATQSRRNVSGPADLHYGSLRRAAAPSPNLPYAGSSGLVAASASDPLVGRTRATAVVVPDTESEGASTGDDAYDDTEEDEVDGDSGVRVDEAAPRGGVRHGAVRERPRRRRV